MTIDLSKDQKTAITEALQYLRDNIDEELDFIDGDITMNHRRSQLIDKLYTVTSLLNEFSSPT